MGKSHLLIIGTVSLLTSVLGLKVVSQEPPPSIESVLALQTEIFPTPSPASNSPTPLPTVTPFSSPSTPPSPTPIFVTSPTPTPTQTSRSTSAAVLQTTLPLILTSPSPSSSASSRSSPTTSLLPTPMPTPMPTPTPTPVAVAVASAQQINGYMDQYAGQYGIDANVLRHIAICESGLNPRATNLIYGGLYQFSPSTWASYRRLLGKDTNADLRFDAQEAILTAAYVLSLNRGYIWPNCLP